MGVRKPSRQSNSPASDRGSRPSSSSRTSSTSSTSRSRNERRRRRRKNSAKKADKLAAKTTGFTEATSEPTSSDAQPGNCPPPPPPPSSSQNLEEVLQRRVSSTSSLKLRELISSLSSEWYGRVHSSAGALNSAIAGNPPSKITQSDSVTSKTTSKVKNRRRRACGVTAPGTGAMVDSVPHAWESSTSQVPIKGLCHPMKPFSTRSGPTIASTAMYKNPFRRGYHPPGPGAYHLPRDDLTEYARAATVVAAGKAKPIPSKEVVPGPGRYLLDTRFHSDSPTPRFMECVQRPVEHALFTTPTPGPQYIGPQPVKPGKYGPFALASKQMLSSEGNSNKLWVASPGPGSYDTRLPPRNRGMYFHKARAQDHDYYNFEGRENATPGPGSYNPPPLPTGIKVVIPCSPNRFKSGVEEFPTPGPGAYL